MARTQLLLGAIVLLAGCDTSLIDNSRVQRWCGSRPCGWEVSGKIARVGTWHSDDYAVSFIGENAQLSQLNATASSNNAECFEFTMLAHVGRDVRMYLELDFLDDGKVDFSVRLPESDFDPLRFLITPPSWYEGVRFILRKDGPGKAVLAELSAQEGYDCDKPAIDLRERPVGAPCERDEQCAAARCELGTCAGCEDDAECGDAQLCGVTAGPYDYVRTCVPTGGDAFGDRCASNAECANGICCQGVCSECCSDTECHLGACNLPADFPHELPAEFDIRWPRQCAPGSGSRASGASCASDSDCASQHCADSRHACEIARCDGDAGCIDLCWAPRVYGGVCD